MKKIILSVTFITLLISKVISQENLPNEQRLIADIKKFPTTLQQIKTHKGNSIAEITDWKQTQDINGFGDNHTKAYSHKWKEPMPFDILKMYVTGNTKKDSKGQYNELDFTITYNRMNSIWVLEDVFVTIRASHFQKSKLNKEEMLSLFNIDFNTGKGIIEAPGNDNMDYIYIGAPKLSVYNSEFVEATQFGDYRYYIGVPVLFANYYDNTLDKITQIKMDTLPYEVYYNPETKKKKIQYLSGVGGFSRNDKYVFKSGYDNGVQKTYDTTFAGLKKVGFESIYKKKSIVSVQAMVSSADQTIKFIDCLKNVLENGKQLNNPEKLKEFMNQSNSTNYDNFIKHFKALEDQGYGWKNFKEIKENNYVYETFGRKVLNKLYHGEGSIYISSDVSNGKKYFEINVR